MDDVIGNEADIAIRQHLRVLCRNSRSLALRMNGEILRYHAARTLQHQTVADHCYHVLRIYREVFGVPASLDIVTAILYHDMEMVVGDVQHTAKAIPDVKEATEWVEKCTYTALVGEEMKELSLEDQLRIKCADLLEMYEFGTREVMFGNASTGNAIRVNIEAAFRKLEHSPVDTATWKEWCPILERAGKHRAVVSTWIAG